MSEHEPVLKGIAAETTSDLPTSVIWGLSYANGYFELGMLDKAERELNRLGSACDDQPEVLVLKSRVLLARRCWERLVTHAKHAIRICPDRPEFYVHAATALDMLGRPAESTAMWDAAPERVRSSGFLRLHVAKFEASLGNLDSARDQLARAFCLDPNLMSVARKDPRLAPLLGVAGKN